MLGYAFRRVLLGFVYMLLRPQGAVTGTLHREGCAQIRQLDIDCDGVVLARVPFRGKATHTNPQNGHHIHGLTSSHSEKFRIYPWCWFYYILIETNSTVFPNFVLCIT